ncbi:coproporphyrinogen dehydrogenase HemZ [Ruminococcus sp.]|uniref:coproporphyrinogen dehydrogenase HemZ n=1 Tax=Ruminococcus sp. TaxID=41978 RepID=UPI0026307B5F|nr:coproporphyrinogen dehydrogenase HemZ [Ruminococcus sp.]MDD6989154.1 coproporphyrinogen dehydrogenase HemZ [Ruminococcus sp.]MDY6202409.1 coproporphyrinogen dehydrogenase HemZ [Ruminococcus sp.]
MNLYVKNHNFWFELENLTRLFFPNEKINVFKTFDSVEQPYIYTEVSDKVKIEVSINNFQKSLVADKTDDNELTSAQLLYKLLCQYSGYTQPWGVLTGVRPVKLFRRLCEELGEEGARNKFLNEFYVSPEKLELAEMTEKNEKKILNLSRSESFSLYVGIPFCPSRCSYCSFVMSSVERAKKLIEPYTELLCEEIKATAQIASDLGLRLETVYFGGGTPTTLNAEQLNKVLKTVRNSFDMSTCREFTVEAGRPDTIDKERLCALKENKVDRISINPQTINDNVLREIGRKHTSEQFFNAFELARKCGFDNINTDLIAGLPTDTLESFVNSLDSIRALSPECVTIHTLCMKRASTLTNIGTTLNREDAETAGKMLEYTQKSLTLDEYIPYYMYRQSRMVGNLENVGWSKKGFESLYNVYVMDETHTILACGSGGVTKLKNNETDYLERIFNFKYPYEYVDRFNELIERKSSIMRFYGK